MNNHRTPTIHEGKFVSFPQKPRGAFYTPSLSQQPPKPGTAQTSRFHSKVCRFWPTTTATNRKEKPLCLWSKRHCNRGRRVHWEVWVPTRGTAGEHSASPAIPQIGHRSGCSGHLAQRTTTQASQSNRQSPSLGQRCPVQCCS